VTNARVFLQRSDLTGLLREYRPAARLAGLERLAGSSKKGVYRVTFDDSATAVIYSWSDAENYWPAGPDDDDDPFPFGDASGPDMLAAASAALAAAGVRTPTIYAWDTSREACAAHLALVEDVRGGSLEQLIAADPSSAVSPIRELGDALRSMSSHHAPRYGKVALAGGDTAAPQQPPEDVLLRRALRHLDAAAGRVSRIASARAAIAEVLAARRAAIRPRAEYGLVHGELGPDHVLLGDDGRPVLIDIEGLTYFDIEWEHAFLRLRFKPAQYRRLLLPAPDEARVSFYVLAQRISLIEGPLRIAGTDYPDRQWMLDLAEYQIARVLQELKQPGAEPVPLA
jgi:aminoglycoside phosphotransferase (APT) family kinase protein